jgi:hypothetical protein
MNIDDGVRNNTNEITKKINVNDDTPLNTNIGDIITPISEPKVGDSLQIKSTKHALETDGVVNLSVKNAPNDGS